MNRIAITDGTGKWFDEGKAECWKEEKWWDGHNHISTATNSQWEHEALYLTASGHWVLNEWSNYAAKRDRYSLIEERQAIVWFLRQGFDLPDQLSGKDSDYEI